MAAEDEQRARAITALAATAVARRTLAQLAAAGIDAVVLKGAALRVVAYAEPSDRTSDDIDLLIPQDRFDDAVRRLCDEGYRVMEKSTSVAVTLQKPGAPLLIDLHLELFAQGQFALDARDVIARSRVVEGVRVPSDEDLFAHLTGHFAIELANGVRHHPGDFEQLSNARALDADRIAAHLASTGLATAALYGLPAAEGPFARSVVKRLQRSRVRRLAAWLAGHAPERRRNSVVITLVAASPARWIARTAAQRGRRWAARWLQRGR